jgi:hypothetical protein
MMALRFAWEDPYDPPAVATRCRRPASKGLHPAYADRWREPFIPFAPASDRFVADDNPALEQQFFDITQAELKPEISAYRATDDRRRKAMAVVKRFCILHHPILLDHLCDVTVPAQHERLRAAIG